VSEEQKDLTPIVIDLNAAKSGELKEFNPLAMLKHGVGALLSMMFGGSAVPVKLRGSKSDVKAFAKALGNEKRYIDAYRKYGLNDARTYKNKYKLNNAIKDFNKKTGLKWPFK